jgi:hypothetical protein
MKNPKEKSDGSELQQSSPGLVEVKETLREKVA